MSGVIEVIANEQFKELRRLAVQATAGHWVTDGAGGVVAEDDQLNGGYFIAECGGPGLDGNSRFIAAASPGVVLALLDGLDPAPAAPAYEARDIEVVRQEFEDSLCRAFDAPESDLDELRKRDSDGGYRNPAVQSCWKGYKVGDMIKAACDENMDRQLILLALANLALLRPGLDPALQTLSGRFGVGAGPLFEYFKNMNRDQVGGFSHPPAGRERILPVRRAGEGGDE